MVIVFALLAALSNAVNVVTQHIASISDPRRSSGWQLVLYLFRNPLWLLGWVALAAAFLFQAFALHDGQVSVVQPLLATELVFALVLRQVWIHQSIRPVTWGAAALTCAGLAVFIVAGEPRGGRPTPTSRHWIAAIVVCGAVAGVLTVLAQRGSPSRRAALYALASATIWALEATFIKATTDTFAEYGVAGMFAHWPVYALALGGTAGTVLQQAALHVGPLRVSQPFLVIVDPIVSIVLSVWLFDEHFVPDAPVLAVAAAGFAAMCVGVVLLTQTAPATMQATPPPSAGPPGAGQNMLWDRRNAEHHLTVSSKIRAGDVSGGPQREGAQRGPGQGSRLSQMPGEVRSAGQPDRSRDRGDLLWCRLGDAGYRRARGQPPGS